MQNLLRIIPRIRPKKLSKDNVGADKVVLHTIKKYKNIFYIILLQPTSPMRTIRDIDACIEKLIKKNLNQLYQFISQIN